MAKGTHQLAWVIGADQGPQDRVGDGMGCSRAGALLGCGILSGKCRLQQLFLFSFLFNEGKYKIPCLET